MPTPPPNGDEPLPRLGFACMWQSRSPAEFSGTSWTATSWAMLTALRRRTETVDLGFHLPKPLGLAYKAAYTRRRGGRWITTYKNGSLWREHAAFELRRSLRRQPCDAVVEIGDLAVLEAPFFLYQDLCYDVLIDEFDATRGEAAHFPGLSRDGLLRLRDRQHLIYEQAAGVLAWSEWLARYLVANVGLPPHKVHVVNPGIELTPDTTPRVERQGPRRRLLFVGGDFDRKGGPLLLEALARLRKSADPEVTLTIAGPASWPGSASPPPGVTFLGPVPRDSMPDLYRSHDVFVMPSHLEAFGKVFIEAQSSGLPCVARDAFAMPEVVVPGESGALVGGDDADELASAIATVLADDALYTTVAANRAYIAERYTWERAADEVLRVVTSSIA